MDNVDKMFLCLGLVAIGMVGFHYFKYRAFEERNNRRY